MTEVATFLEYEGIIISWVRPEVFLNNKYSSAFLVSLVPLTQWMESRFESSRIRGRPGLVASWVQPYWITQSAGYYSAAYYLLTWSNMGNRYYSIPYLPNKFPIWWVIERNICYQAVYGGVMWDPKLHLTEHLQGGPCGDKMYESKRIKTHAHLYTSSDAAEDTFVPRVAICRVSHTALTNTNWESRICSSPDHCLGR